MPKHFYSKINNDLMFTINKYEEISKSRTDITPEKEILQASAKILSKGENFPPHKHNYLKRETTTTQESWVIIEGKILAFFYDIDDSLMGTYELTKGDMAIVYKAGHSFNVIEDNTVLYEFKNGPYYGKTKDKTMINKKFNREEKWKKL